MTDNLVLASLVTVIVVISALPPLWSVPFVFIGSLVVLTMLDKG